MRCSQILVFCILLFNEYYLTITFTGFVLGWPSKVYVATVQRYPERTMFLYNYHTIKSHILINLTFIYSLFMWFSVIIKISFPLVLKVLPLRLNEHTFTLKCHIHCWAHLLLYLILFVILLCNLWLSASWFVINKLWTDPRLYCGSDSQTSLWGCSEGGEGRRMPLGTVPKPIIINHVYF